jgi:HSP20 family protein
MRRRLGDALSVRALARGAFPEVNIGTSPKSIEVYAFALGIDPAKLAVNIERGLRQKAAFECPPSGSDDGRSAACLGTRSPLVIRHCALAIGSVLDIAS